MGKHKLKLGFDGKESMVTVDVPAGEPKPWDRTSKLKTVGAPVPRIDGALKASGEATYTFDVALPEMLYAAVLRCPHPAATLEAIDLSKARSAPGVVEVLSLADSGAAMLFAGQDVAAVAADRPERAREALASIEATWAVRPAVVDTEEAAAPGAPTVHQGEVKRRKTEGDDFEDDGPSKKASGNVRPGRSQKRGNAKASLKRAAVTHEATYKTQCHTHAALESHGLAVRWDDDTHMTVWASTQSIFSVRNEMASMFDLRPKDVHVITKFLGGGFGAKFGANAPGSALGKIAGELARSTKRPVHLMLPRDEEHLCTGNRPDSVQRVRIGGSPKSGGSITAIHIQAKGSAGIGTGAGVGRNAFGIYAKVPDVLVESADVFTNAGPGAAFRAPGHPQGAFAIESAIDELARKMEVDPIELRLKHDSHPVRRYQLELGRDRLGWKEARKQNADRRGRGARVRTGIGMASSIWGDYGSSGAVVTVAVDREGHVSVKNGVQDIGTGITTVLAQIVAEVLGRPVGSIEVEIGDSQLGPGVGSGGSKTTSSVAPAARNAAEHVKTQLSRVAAKALGASNASKVKWTDDGGARFGTKSVDFAAICAAMDTDAVVGTGTRPDTYGAHPKAYPGSDLPQIAGVQFAQVEVDTWTGVVKCKNVLAIHDCGRVMNALTVRSQINGGVILGTGYALTEARIMDTELGIMLNPNLEQYKACGARDCPDIEVVLTEVAAGNNNTGTIGIGEPATIPTAAAIANAVGDALGVHVRQLPITPKAVLETLAKGGA